MKTIMRSVGAVVAGVVAGGILVAVMEKLGHVVFPPPVGIDLSQPEQLAALMKDIPLGALLSVLVAWFVGTSAGAWLAARLSGRAPYFHGSIVGAFFLAAGIANMVMIPHPMWFWFAGIAVFPVSAWLGARLATGGKNT